MITKSGGFRPLNGVRRSGIGRAMLAVFAVLALSGAGLNGQTAPSNTNPGNHVVFPSKGQTPQQQAADESAAYNWATQQTGFNPDMAYQQMQQTEGAAAQTAASTQGNAVRGAARGALLGVAIGAIAGDAGEGAAIGAAAGGLTHGMMSRRTRQAAQSTASAAQQQYQQQFANWDRYWVAAMQGKGYSVD